MRWVCNPMLTEAEIQVALKTIIGPTYGMSLAALQMVRSPYPLRSCA